MTTIPEIEVEAEAPEWFQEVAESDAEVDLEMQSMARWAYYGITDNYMQAALNEWSD